LPTLPHTLQDVRSTSRPRKDLRSVCVVRETSREDEHMSVYVAAERENAAIKSWDGKRLVLRAGKSIRLHGDQCLGCGGTEQVEARARSFRHAASSRQLAGVFLTCALPFFVGPFGKLLGFAVMLSAYRTARVTFPLCADCAYWGPVLKAIGGALGLVAFLACPVIGAAIGHCLDPHSVDMAIVGFWVGSGAFCFLWALWRMLLTRVAVTCVSVDNNSVTLRVPCGLAIDDMVARLDER
jgi:hypothetical protein